MSRQPNPDNFLKQLTGFMNSKQLPLDINPIIAGRPVNLMVLFQAVQRSGGFRAVTQGNLWPQISNALGFPPQQVPEAPAQMRSIFERNLFKFEEMYMQNRKMGQPQPGMANMAAVQASTPTKAGVSGQAQQAHAHQGQVQTPMKQTPQASHQPGVNGFSTPQPPHPGQQANAALHGHARNSLSRSVQPTPTQDEFPPPPPAQNNNAGRLKMFGLHLPNGQIVSSDGTVRQFTEPHPNKDSGFYIPCGRQITTYGGLDLGLASLDKPVADVVASRPDAPHWYDLGNIDIQALTRSLQCGIRSEVRLALDTLATITAPAAHQLGEINLAKCDDLVECLIECAEEQVELLVGNAPEISDDIHVAQYEDVVRACRQEVLTLREIPAFGTPEYELDKTVDRLLSITTILRNLSFAEINHDILSDEEVIKFLCTTINYLGTRNMLLRTHADTLDLMKDLVIFLSNVSTSVVIPGEEEAFCLLQFLLAFAPTPSPSLADGKLFFTSYEPHLHPYLPAAVDALAKLLARDEPNRSFFKTIFTEEMSSETPAELLTKTFALAISPIPEQNNENRPLHMLLCVEARKPFIMQGLLAGDILASLAPGHESGLTRAWLECGSGFAQSVFRLIRALSSHFEGGPAARNSARAQIPKSEEQVYIVALGASMLRRLSEKAKDPGDPESSIPPNLVPSQDSVLGALQMSSPEWTRYGFLKQLVAYASLEE